MGTNCAPLIADSFLFCYEKYFMSYLHESKQYDLMDMCNDTSRYIDDMFTIDNPEFGKIISDIYPTDLQLNEANTSDKETSFLDLNIKVIGIDMFLDSNRMVFIFLSWLDLLDVAIAFRISILKIVNPN